MLEQRNIHTPRRLCWLLRFCSALRSPTMTTTSESYVLPSEPSPQPDDPADDDDLDSLPSTSTSTSLDDDELVSDAEREWRESLQQLELLLTIFVIPYVGKYFGRKAAYWGKWH